MRGSKLSYLNSVISISFVIDVAIGIASSVAGVGVVDVVVVGIVLFLPPCGVSSSISCVIGCGC